MAVAQIAASQGRSLKSAPGFVLRTDAAIALDNACAAFGKNLILTGAWRSYETQERIFRERYQLGGWSPFGDYRKWKGQTWARVRGAAAAVPGTSNHGGGVAIDVKTRRDSSDPARTKAVVFTGWGDSDRLAFLKAAKPFGWRDIEGQRVGELWHITYYPQYDLYRGKVIKPGTASSTKIKPHTIATISDHHHYESDWRERLWQNFLIENKFLPKGSADGDFGAKTKKGTQGWQGKAELSKDGTVGKSTWYRSAWGVEKGDKGYRVQIAQRILGLTGKAVDGSAGDIFVKRTKRMQSWLGVPQTGKFDNATINALLKKG